MRRKAPMLCLSLKVNVDLTGNVTEFLSHDLFFFLHMYIQLPLCFQWPIT